VNSPQSEQRDSAAAAAGVPVNTTPGPCSSSSEDEEVAAINTGCKHPPTLICSQQPAVTYNDSNGSDSSTNDLDLELIERN